MTTNDMKKWRCGMTLIATALLLGGCDDDVSQTSKYDIDNACVERPIPEDTHVPVYTNGPVTDASSLSASIIFDDAERLTGSVPGATGGTGLVFPNVVVTDKSIQTLFVRGSVPDGKRIGALFVEIIGVGEYFAIPIERGGPTGSTTGSPIQVVLRGPFPEEGTEGEIDIIQNQIVNNLRVKAFLVDASAPPPDVTAVDFEGADISSNWLIPAETRTITGENVGGGGFQITLFWDATVDADLWLIEPDDHKIYFADKNSVSGDGFLDFDNTVGYGPENIFFEDDIPAGTYTIQLDHFAGATDTNFSITLNACGSTRSFSGNLDQDETKTIYTFTYGPDCVLPDSFTPHKPNVFEEAVVCDQPSQAE